MFANNLYLFAFFAPTIWFHIEEPLLCASCRYLAVTAPQIIWVSDGSISDLLALPLSWLHLGFVAKIRKGRVLSTFLLVEGTSSFPSFCHMGILNASSFEFSCLFELKPSVISN